MAEAAIGALKACTKCGAEKPADRHHFPPVGKGLRPRCRPCWQEHEREYFWANRERKREIATGVRQRADKARRKEKLDAWRAANPDKVRFNDLRRSARIKTDPTERAKASERQRRWRENNPDKVRSQRRERYKDPEVAQRSREATRRWRQANAETAREKDRQYRAAHPEYVIEHAERRRARLLRAEGDFTGNDVIALIKSYGRVCYYCSTKLKKFQVDHFIPLSRGGSNWPNNLVIACQPCNGSKAAKMPWEWKPERFLPGAAPY
jgi:5-methylcytosine-specific restriction endonuclease McrA